MLQSNGSPVHAKHSCPCTRRPLAACAHLALHQQRAVQPSAPRGMLADGPASSNVRNRSYDSIGGAEAAVHASRPIRKMPQAAALHKRSAGWHAQQAHRPAEGYPPGQLKVEAVVAGLTRRPARKRCVTDGAWQPVSTGGPGLPWRKAMRLFAGIAALATPEIPVTTGNRDARWSSSSRRHEAHQGTTPVGAHQPSGATMRQMPASRKALLFSTTRSTYSTNVMELTCRVGGRANWAGAGAAAGCCSSPPLDARQLQTPAGHTGTAHIVEGGVKHRRLRRRQPRHASGALGPAAGRQPSGRSGRRKGGGWEAAAPPALHAARPPQRVWRPVSRPRAARDGSASGAANNTPRQGPREPPGGCSCCRGPGECAPAPGRRAEAPAVQGEWDNEESPTQLDVFSFGARRSMKQPPIEWKWRAEGGPTKVVKVGRASTATPQACGAQAQSIIAWRGRAAIVY